MRGHPGREQAERLESDKKELYWANYRLDHARERLDQLGRLSLLHSQRRREKASTLDQIDRFTDDVRTAEAKIDGCEISVEELRPEADRRSRWDVEHRFPDARLRTVESELADLGLSPELSQSLGVSPLRRAPDGLPWLDRLAEVARPPLPGHDMGAGIDIGL